MVRTPPRAQRFLIFALLLLAIGLASAQDGSSPTASPSPAADPSTPAPIPPPSIGPTPAVSPTPTPFEIRELQGVDPSPASQIPWKAQPYSMLVQGREIGEFLANFGRLHGIKVVVSPGVTGQVNGKFEDIAPDVLFDQLARAYNFSWFYSAGVLFVTSDTELQTEIVNLPVSDTTQAAASLNALGLITSDGGVQRVPGSNMVLVSGPPQYVEIARRILLTIDEEDQYRQKTESIIEVFPLKYAWAYDIELSGNDGSQNRIEGVASTLSRLVGGRASNPANQFTSNGAARQVPGVIDTTFGQQPVVVVDNTQPQPPPEEGADERTGQRGASGPRITADVRRNAVVIRDVRENMPFYRDAIAQLDVPAKVVEISAAIVDLRVGASASLGLNTVAISANDIGIVSSGTGALTNSTASGARGDGVNLLPNNNLAPTNAAQPNILASGVFGTLQVTAAINALEEDNQAKIISRPTVMTLDNYAATISRQESFFVDTTGENVSNLFNVTTGLNLQVVPHVIEEPSGPKIYMQIKIEDGSFSNEEVASIPRVQQSSLTTQSVVLKDQSLLIGGLYIKVDQDQRSGYPWLRDIPVVGYLFGVAGRQAEVVERLFLITPRVVNLRDRSLGDYQEYFRPGPLQEQAIRRAQPVAPKAVIVETPAPRPSRGLRLPWAPGSN